MIQINRCRLFHTFSDLVSIDSPSFGERQLADALKTKFSDLGVSLQEDDAGETIGGNCGNLYGYLAGTLPGPPLLFSAHLDTVEPSHGKKAVLLEDGTIVSAGSTVLGADDLSGISSILEAIQVIKGKTLPHRDIELLFTVAEEKYSGGASHFDYDQLRAKEGYVLDLSGSIGSLARRAPTILAFTAVFSGRSAHAGFAPETGIHAIAAAAKAISMLQQGYIEAFSTLNVGMIEGGVATNIVPNRCTVRGEIRSFSHPQALAHYEKLKTHCEDAAAAFGASVSVEHSIGCKAYEIPADHSAVQRFERACGACKIPFTPISTFGGSDNNHFIPHGLSSVVIACGMEQCHSTAEYSSLDALSQCAALVVQLMTDPQ